MAACGCEKWRAAGWRVWCASCRRGDPINDMTPGEHAYRERILTDSAAVYAQEARAFRAKREAWKATFGRAAGVA